MKLAWVSDLHLRFVQEATVESCCRALVAAQPDAVLIGGDIAEAHSLIDWLCFFEARLQRPLYFVLGNHDYYGDRIAAVRERVAAACATSRWLRWLDTAGVVPLTVTTGLVGHGGWADGRYGDYTRAPMLLNDYVQIADFAGQDDGARARLLARLGDEAAAYLRTVLPEALDRYAHVILLTHVPPFREACWHEGHLSDDASLPHFACRAVGEVLLELMTARPDRQMSVLCGHTHGAGQAWVRPNLHVQTAGATYGYPAIQALLHVP